MKPFAFLLRSVENRPHGLLSINHLTDGLSLALILYFIRGCHAGGVSEQGNHQGVASTVLRGRDLSVQRVGVISYSHAIETRLLMNLQTNDGEGMEKVSKEILNGAVHIKTSLWVQKKC